MCKQEILRILAEGKYSCVAWQGGIRYQARGRGIQPLITPMREKKNFFAGMQVGDTIIGKAAALLLVLSGVESVYGELMSKAAVRVFQAHGIPYEYAQLVDFIQNRQQDGLCPLEQEVLEEDNPEKAWLKLEAKLAQLMSGK